MSRRTVIDVYCCCIYTDYNWGGGSIVGFLVYGSRMFADHPNVHVLESEGYCIRTGRPGMVCGGGGWGGGVHIRASLVC